MKKRKWDGGQAALAEIEAATKERMLSCCNISSAAVAARAQKKNVKIRRRRWGRKRKRKRSTSGRSQNGK